MEKVMLIDRNGFCKYCEVPDGQNYAKVKLVTCYGRGIIVTFNHVKEKVHGLRVFRETE